MTLTPPVLQTIVALSLATRPDEIACDECDLHVDRFAEMTLAGMPAAQALPLVEEHLDKCPPCREEFEALVVVLRVAEREGRSWWRRWRSR